MYPFRPCGNNIRNRHNYRSSSHLRTRCLRCPVDCPHHLPVMPRWYENPVPPSKSVARGRHIRSHGHDWRGTQFFGKLDIPHTLSPLSPSPSSMSCHRYSFDDSEVKSFDVRHFPQCPSGRVTYGACGPLAIYANLDTMTAL